MAGLDMPKFSFKYTDLDDEKQRRKLIAWLIQLDEKLRYLLDNIDEENLSEGLAATLEETRSAIQLTAKGLEEARASIQLLPDQIRIAIEGIDEFHTEGVGTEILLTKEQAKIITPEFVVSIPKTDDDTISLQIDRDGAVMDYLSVGKKLVAPNMAEKYIGAASLTVGTNGDFPTLQAAFDTLNDRVVTENVTIWLLNNITENAELKGVMGGGSVRLTGYLEGSTNRVLTGSVDYEGCACRLYVNDLTILGAGRGYAISAQACAYLDINGVVLDGQGQVSGISAIQGSTLKIQDTELYNAISLIEIYDSILHATDCQGGQCTNYLEAGHCIWTWDGDRPTGAYLEDSACISKDNSTGSESGSAPTPSTVTIHTTNFTATTGCRGNDWNNNGLWQGAVGSVVYKTCMWFDLSELAGKSLLKAALTLTRKGGAGGSSPVELHLYTTPVTSTAENPNPLDGAVYQGKIGEIGNNERLSFDIPTAAVQAIFNSGGNQMGGLMLYVSEESRSVGYSKNYARFGDTGADAPVLTVQYETNQ